MSSSEIALPFRVGARTILTLRRRLVRRRLSLEEALSPHVPALPRLDAEADGYWLSGWPASRLAELARRESAMRLFVRQAYPRSYARLDAGFDAWLGTLSSRTRSTLRRKVRKLAERSGGTLDLRSYADEAGMRVFHREARRLSARTYQERLLGAGLPDGEAAIAEMQALARADRVRAWILFVDGEPASYLYAPAEGATLLYSCLGYDPDLAAFSPGTVLQHEVMRELMAQDRFALFDFTEGDGQHKRLFATDSIDCVDMLLVRPTLANRLAGQALSAFDAAVAIARRAAPDRLVRALRR